MPVYNPRNRHVYIRKIWKCDGCGRTLPIGSHVLHWRIWDKGIKTYFHFCSECEAVIYGCKDRPPLDTWGTKWMVRDLCEQCDDYPLCGKIRYLKDSEEGDIFYGDLDLG